MKYFSILIFLLICNIANGQRLIESRQTSYYTYIFKINDREARRIYKKDLSHVEASSYHTLVDSFPTDSTLKKIMPAGHYLKVHTDKNRLICDITSVQDFEVKILKNNTDLGIQVFDLNGEIITDAKVLIHQKHLRYDKNTMAYIDKKSNQKGVLEVTYNGFTAFYNLKRQYNNSAFKRTTRSIVYGTPVKYVWLPVRYVIFLPIDGVKSIAEGYPQGTIQRTGRFFTKAYHKIACIFDDYNCDYYGDDKFRNNHTGYIVFNKPKYLPGDTVKLKAFITSKKGKSITNPVNVVLQTPKKNIRLATVLPYRDGGFKYEFYLSDSLELQLDRNYLIMLEKKEGKEYITGSFKYEDYELRSLHLKLTASETELYHGKNIEIKAKGTDENDLNILDGRLQVLIKPGEISRYHKDYVFIPDTLAFWNLNLEKESETKITIPDSLFPAADLGFDAVVTLLTSSNETITETQHLNYFFHKSEVIYRLLNDSIGFTYQRDGIAGTLNAKIYGSDNFGNRTLVREGLLPASIKINPFYSEYFIDTDSVKTRVDVLSEKSLLQCFSDRSRDIIQIVVKNPRKLPFSYFIYKKNKEKSRGFGDSLNLNIHTSTKENYFLSMQYLWGGKLTDENYKIQYNDKKLIISVIEPKIVYPSQTATIELLVTDPEGNPVPDADLTAYSMTKKFDYSPPSVPDLDKPHKNKTIINNFYFKDQSFESNQGLLLDYNNWRLLAGLDSIEYYKFIYPGNSIYRFQYKAPVTQFAPFVISRGGIEPIEVIYLDKRPVYFSWSTNIQPYSFLTDSGYHHLKLRTLSKTIEIDSLYFQPGTKTILSINDDIINRIVNISKAEPHLANDEKNALYRYIFPYEYRFGEYYGYIEQNSRAIFLKPDLSETKNNLAGPVNPTGLKFQLVDSFSINFMHEPFYKYEFSPGLLKMKSVDTKSTFPDYLYIYKSKESLSDNVLNAEDVKNSWKDHLEWKRYSTARYNYPRNTSAGKGKMQINFTVDNDTTAKRALNILLFRYDDHNFLRIYPGNNLTYHDLAEGYYRLLFFYPGSEYSTFDSVYVASDGLNNYKVRTPEIHIRDSFSIYVSKIIEDNIFISKASSGADENRIKQIFHMYREEFGYKGAGNIIEGYVYDEEENPLPGVNVIVKGTTYGTLSNSDGYYSLNVPLDHKILSFSYIGFEPEEVDVSSKSIVNVYLTASVQRLEEVVVTAYGVQKKSSLMSASVVTVSGNQESEMETVSSLQGRVAGVSITKSDSPGGISIQLRGNVTTTFNGKPLYVIDGFVYTGDFGELDPDLIKEIKILKGDEATAIYGSLGINGVVIINTGGAFRQTQPFSLAGADYSEAFLEAASQSSSIRNNFSDYAFWQPDLITDRNGKASFRVKFPDDVTGWETFYLAMNNKRQSGQSRGLIKSYKPLMAQLLSPRFLLENDTAFAIGKILNYTPDTISLSTKFEIDNQLISSRQRSCTRTIIDTLEVTANHQDSLSVKYYLEKDDGYFDGEKRSIPVYPVGVEETIGQFLVLENDTTLKITFNPVSENVKIYAKTDALEIIEDETARLIDYKYSCNEQLASKLKALLADQTIYKFQNKAFRKKNQVETVIRLVIRNQKEDGLWGWWKSSAESSLWISLHVLEGLMQAKEMGYKVPLDEGKISDMLSWELEKSTKAEDKLNELRILKVLNSRVDFPAYIERIAKTQKLNINQLFQLIELKQQCNIKVKTDTLNSFIKETMFGNIYFPADTGNFRLLASEIQNTLIAYRILRCDSTAGNGSTLQKIRNYLFENRSGGSWLNTYESSQIIETILPDMLKDQSHIVKPKIELSGAIEKSVDKFPFETTVSAKDTLMISKSGDYPVYFTAWQKFRNQSPAEKKSEFEIIADFENLSSGVLKAGKEVKLIVRIKVMKDADYVMINVPIPAGCSYSDKSAKSPFEVHRESFRNETSIFCEKLKKGNYEFTIDLMPKYTGRFTINPAKVELMYFPTFNANNSIKKITIE